MFLALEQQVIFIQLNIWLFTLEFNFSEERMNISWGVAIKVPIHCWESHNLLCFTGGSSVFGDSLILAATAEEQED